MTRPDCAHGHSFARGATRMVVAAVALFLTCLASLPSVRAGDDWKAPENTAGWKNPLPPQPEVIAQGRALYMDRCVDCHGNKGKGDGPGAADLEHRPTDLAHKKMMEQPEGALFWKITQGRRPMPAYGKKLTEEQRWQLVQFIRTLAPK